MKHYVGIDIGGTNMVCGLTDETGRTLRMTKVATEAQRGSENVIERLGKAVSGLIAESGVSPEAVGIGIPGFVDHVNGVSVLAVNLGWKNVPITSELSKHLGGLPVYLNHDVRMYVYGEAVAGAGQGYKHVFGLTVGTGLAAAMVNEGRLYYGSGGRAGEFGHIPVPDLDYHCNCGMIGCLETAVSATGIARQAREAVQRGESTILAERFSGDNLQKLTAADVSRAYDEGDPAAIAIMERTGTLLGRGLAAAIPLFSPEAIVIGGGGSLAGERLFAPMRKEIERSTLSFYLDNLVIKPAERIEDAGIVGSALYAKQRLNGTDIV
ncbi:ROK family protein [Paenibacillus tyrfis]|uniref:ROK family transcriptional regulator n=1 Tax=Paenibacillus tyrfis TaxID=1501230 RepID=A0A081P4Y1_9BACL|nr:ROK family protein [Paenibacillus tyrfis]KEQ25754.1 ROK family transcriptional regulator [Paenibacillus tyrfis]